MSSERRASSASSARRVSRRLRSRMRGWERAPSAQIAGSAIFSSMAARSRRSRAESKILPQIADFVADRGVGVFEISKHDLILEHWVTGFCLKSKGLPRICTDETDSGTGNSKNKD